MYLRRDTLSSLSLRLPFTAPHLSIIGTTTNTTSRHTSHRYPYSGARSLLLALATTAILPAIEHIGVVGTDAIAAGLGWFGFA